MVTTGGIIYVTTTPTDNSGMAWYLPNQFKGPESLIYVPHWQASWWGHWVDKDFFIDEGL